MDTLSYDEHGRGQLDGDLLAGTYRLVRLIGRGGMGEVYEAAHARLPGRFAVKILLPELLTNREAFARFCREAEIMSELRHPNIVQVFDFNKAPDSRPYFVMEYLEGRDLEVRLEQPTPLALPAIVRIVNAIGAALAAAHAHGVIHRDLKPSNVFLATVNGQTDELVKVLDFGISKLRSASTRLSHQHNVLGTPLYMAPEQARGQMDAVDGRADQFALGLIAYRMLTGRDAFRGDDTTALLYQVVHEDPPRLAESLPASWDTRPLQAVLDRALAKEPAERWAGMMELARAFEDAAERTLGASEVNRLPVAARPAASVAAAVAPAAAAPAAAAPAAAPVPLPEVSIDIDASDLDEPPPVRQPPPLRLVTPPPSRRRAAVQSHRGGPAALQLPAVDTDERPTHRRSVESWDLPSGVDKIPVSRTRAGVLGVIALGLVALMIAKGWHREVPVAFNFLRDNIAALSRRPMPLPQPHAAQAEPSTSPGAVPATGAAVPAPAPGAPAEGTATAPADPAAAAAAPPAPQGEAAPSPPQGEAVPPAPAAAAPAAPEPEHPAAAAPDRRAERRQAARAERHRRAAAREATPLSRPGSIDIPPPREAAPADEPAQGTGGFSIAPPKDQAATRDLAPASPGDAPLPPSP